MPKRIPFIRDIRLTKTEFNNAARNCLRMAVSNKALAKRVLVEGEMMQHVAREAGINTASLRQSILKIYDAHLKLLQIKNRLFVMDIELPLTKPINDEAYKELANDIMRYARSALAKYTK